MKKFFQIENRPTAEKFFARKRKNSTVGKFSLQKTDDRFKKTEPNNKRLKKSLPKEKKNLSVGNN